MANQPMQTISGIEPNVMAALPEDADIVDHTRDGGIVVREPVGPTEKEPVYDDEGERVTRTYKTDQGVFETPVWEWTEPDETRLVKYEPRKTGRVVRNEHFQESEEEIERRKRRQKVEQFKDTLAERAIDAGVDVDELVSRLSGDASQSTQAPAGGVGTRELPDTPPEAPQPPQPDAGAVNDDTEHVAGYELEMIRPGVWSMPDGSEWGTGSREDAIAHIRAEFGDELADLVAED